MTRFDFQKALSIADGDKELLAELIDSFEEYFPELMKDISKALAEYDGETLRAKAHSIKGSAANLGALELSALAAELEMQGFQVDFGKPVDQALREAFRAFTEEASAKMKETVR